MVDELLALARAESGVSDDGEYFDPIALTDGIISDARFEAQAAGVHIRILAPALEEHLRPSIQGSARLVRRALENVVRNALRFSPAGGTVEMRIEIDHAPLRYRFIIADEGPGADSGAIDTLFDPFVRGDAAGTGLGLAIAKRAVLAHGGSIDAHNRKGGGFLVEIGIPAVSHDPSV